MDANPLEDVSAASRISGVLIRGRWIDRREIDDRLRALAAGGAYAARGDARGASAVIRAR